MPDDEQKFDLIDEYGEVHVVSALRPHQHRLAVRVGGTPEDGLYCMSIGCGYEEWPKAKNPPSLSA